MTNAVSELIEEYKEELVKAQEDSLACHSLGYPVLGREAEVRRAIYEVMIRDLEELREQFR